ncbi:ComEA family DNA-binding protein [Microbacterium ureisolvens]|uniref:ComEA family DNA-binding protein n=1 Tax=Microbacterium ureisolvens TaxID=2781186 RepID=UPI0036405AB2
MTSSARAAAATDAPSIGWLLGMSSWMLLTVIPGPILTWLGFAIIGFASRSRRLIILGVVWGAAALLASFELWGQWQPLVRAIVYLAGMVVALAVNPGWLRTMWQRRLERTGQASAASRARESTWHRASGAKASGTGEAAPAKKPARRSRRQRNAAAAAAAAQRASAADEAAKAKAAGAAASAKADALADAVGASSDDLVAAEAATEPIDVNTAPAAELEKLPGMTRSRARRAVKERDAQGGFTSVEDFGETVGLQPHEIVRLRPVAICSPRPRGERRFGRRVDY